MLQIRPCTEADIPALLNLIDAANQVDQAGWYYTTADLAEALQKDQPIPPDQRIHLLYHGDQLAGYYRLDAEDTLEGVKVLCFGCVHPAFRRQGLGARLLEQAAHTAQAAAPRGAKILFQVPARRNVPGIYALCEKSGLQMARQFSVLKRDTRQPIPPCQTKLSAQLNAFDPAHDGADLLAAFDQCFPGHSYKPEILDKEWRKTRENLGYWWVARDPTGLLTGFCLAGVEKEAEEEPIGLIDYLGVLPAARRQGLGRCLLYTAMHYLQMIGLPAIKLATEVDNLRALSLYYEAGFETWREARLYQKRL
ncbi:hypothetical protein ADN00_05590 [Ornatilinea apprima]|uniref:N-acetyltransferase domain-containing protein n=1 Tax=Ornatilinea apprima TaxID=1134406 RepID=A0A0P6X9F8_9CHLR|nr:GNAT family N-acetyltransferase [Ornatilinea apprima]KPL78716.1 hypothetical protein ADN00_05590 [Ornatilinea apprima]